MADLTACLGRLRLKNPVMPASGTFSCFEDNPGAIDPGSLGAVVTKTVTLVPRPGNPPPRLLETACGLLNTVGLPSPGIGAFLSEELPRLRMIGTALIVSIAGERMREYAELAVRLGQERGVAALELNLSCPNVEKGLNFSSDARMLAQVVTAVRRETTLPVIAKLSPNVASIVEMARTAADAGADAVSAVNTFQGMAVDVLKRRPVFHNIHGGLSGPAIKPLALKAVWDIYRGTSIPIIGMGGISTPDDALEFLLAGASAVAIGTANFFNPLTMAQVIEGIQDYLEEGGFASLGDITGLAHDDFGGGGDTHRVRNEDKCR